MNNYSPPNDVHAEAIVIGKILIENSLFEEFFKNTNAICPDEDGFLGRSCYFFSSENRSLFHAIEITRRNGCDINLITICENIDVSLRAEITNTANKALLENDKATEDFLHYVKVIKEMYGRRQVITEATALIRSMYIVDDPDNFAYANLVLCEIKSVMKKQLGLGGG